MVLAFISWPTFVWLRGRASAFSRADPGVPWSLFVGVGVLALVIGSSISGMAGRLGIYAENSRLNSAHDAWFASHGTDRRESCHALAPDTIAAAFDSLQRLDAALYQGFVILLLLLFFLVEGPALADRLRLSLDERDPNPARLADLAVMLDSISHYAPRSTPSLVWG